MTGWIGISLGDVTGIGPEVTLKALAADHGADDTCYLIIGDLQLLSDLRRQLSLDLELRPFVDQSAPGRVFVHNPLKEPLPSGLRPGDGGAARAAIAWLKDAGERCLRGELDGMVTAPVNKESIVRAGHVFVGQTEYLSQLAGAKRTAMMLLGQDDRGRWLRVTLATTHVPIKLLAERLTREKVELAIELAAQSCRELGLQRARVGVCGLNPHAGEGGAMGTEEQTTIGPAVEAMRGKNIDAVGPMSADALFHYAYRGDYDVVVAMYHDQGLAPLKMVAFEQGVNWTVGLPFIRTSPDHGTGYDIAGKGTASPTSMLAAMSLAKQLARKNSRT